MFNLIFFKNARGQQPVKEIILELEAKRDKNSVVNSQKIHEAVEVLRNYGTTAGRPYIDHLEGEIYELRALRHRILFFKDPDDNFVLTHHFIKKDQKTPKKEIETAKRRMKQYLKFIDESD